MRVRAALASAACALVVGGLIDAGTAPAEARPQTTLGRSDFPTIGAVAKQYPHFRGGSVDLFRSSRQATDLPSADCTGYDTSSVRVQRSRIADYLMRGGETAYFQGLADPTVAVYLYATPAGAAGALAELRHELGRCWGTHGDSSYAVTYQSRPMPKLGADRLAYRRTTQQAGMGKDYAAETWVRDGRFLVNTRVQLDPAPPRLQPLYGLSRAAVAAAGR